MYVFRRNPDLIDAGITRYFFFRDVMDYYGTADYVSFENFFKVEVKVLNA